MFLSLFPLPRHPLGSPECEFKKHSSLKKSLFRTSIAATQHCRREGLIGWFVGWLVGSCARPLTRNPCSWIQPINAFILNEFHNFLSLDGDTFKINGTADSVAYAKVFPATKTSSSWLL